MLIDSEYYSPELSLKTYQLENQYQKEGENLGFITNTLIHYTRTSNLLMLQI